MSKPTLIFTGRLWATLAFLGLVLACSPAVAQVHGCTPETATDRTGEAIIYLDWDFGHSSCILVDPGTTVLWVVASNWSVHPLTGGLTPISDNSNPISLADIEGNVASVTFDTPGDYPYFCQVHTTTMTGVVYVATPPPLVEAPPAQRYALTGQSDFFINGAVLAVDTNGNGAVDSLNLPVAITVRLSDIPEDAVLEQAYLYWGGGQDQPGEQVPGTPDDIVTLTVPGASPAPVAADVCYGADGGASSYDVFVCRADITALVATEATGLDGDYLINDYSGRVGDRSTDHASAVLLMIYSHQLLKPNTVVVYDGLLTLSSGDEVLTTMEGFTSPGLGASFAWYTLEGDIAGTGVEFVSLEGQPGGGTQQLSDALNPPNNPMNQTINIPGYEATDSISLDVDRFQISVFDEGDTSARVTWAAGTDKWWLALGVLGVSQPPLPLVFADGFEGE